MEITVARYASTLNGALVRSTSHARAPPITNDNTVDPPANTRLFQMLVNESRSLNNFQKCPIVVPGTAPATSVVVTLSCSSIHNGGSINTANTTPTTTAIKRRGS